jgi:hypothetical protein
LQSLLQGAVSVGLMPLSARTPCALTAANVESCSDLLDGSKG